MNAGVISPAASVPITLTTEHGICALTTDRLDLDSVVAHVRHDSAGATATFIGTTRNSFKGRTVSKLEYQAYSKLAMKTIANILRDAVDSAEPANTHSVYPPAEDARLRCAVYHRLGVVPVGEPSIVIAVSSPHRKQAFVACERILEDVKDKAQIWKREWYEGDREDEAQWKANH